MNNIFGLLDYVFMAIYFSLLVGLGLYLKNKASRSIEDYFIGGRKMPWWLMGISGTAQFVDIAGTALIISFLFLIGPKALLIELRGGLCIHMAVAMLWAGKWHRRSRCITGAEWTIFRFGNGPSGQAARIITAIAVPIFIIGMVIYLSTAVGIFFSMFVPFSPKVCSAIIIAIACVYTAMSGFYGVVFTDLFQAIIIVTAVIVFTVMAVSKVWAPGSDFPVLAEQVSGMSHWMSSVPKWKIDMPAGYEGYNFIGILALFYLFKAAIVDGFGTGGDPKFFGARNDRACGKLAFMWTTMMTFRWPLMISCAILGIYLINEKIPDQNQLSNAAIFIKAEHTSIEQDQWQDKLTEIVSDPNKHEKLTEQLEENLGDSWAQQIRSLDFEGQNAAMLIKSNFSDIKAHQWKNKIFDIQKHPEKYSLEFIEQLKTTLGENWEDKLMLLSYSGTINGERILPAVIINSIPNGLKGLILIALLAACMSTFDSNVNFAVGFLTRDIFQAYIKPNATTKQLVRVSWFFTAFIAVTGYMLAYRVEKITDIWGFLMMGLGAGFMVPSFIKFYWWRYNGWGFAGGMAAGVLCAIIIRTFGINLGDIGTFVAVAICGATGAVVGTLLTKPTDLEAAKNFYIKTKPFGFWGRFKQYLDPETLKVMKKEHFYDLITLPFAIVWHFLLLLLPVQLVIGNFKEFRWSLGIFAICSLALYFFWYRNLPKENRY